MTVGQFLMMLRHEAGLTQKQAAEHLGLSNKTISRWETDRGLPDVDLLKKVAEMYGVTVDELLAGGRKQPVEKEKEQEVLQQQLLLEEKHFQSNCGILNLFLGVGMLLFLYVYFFINYRKLPMSYGTVPVIRGCYLLVWLGISLVVGFLNWRRFHVFLKDILSLAPQLKPQIQAARRRGIGRLCAIGMCLMVGFLPFFIKQEFRTYAMASRDAAESYKLYNPEGTKEDLRAFVRDVFMKMNQQYRLEEAIEHAKELRGWGPNYLQTYLQYLPMSACIGWALWELGCLVIWLNENKRQGNSWNKNHERRRYLHVSLLLAGVAILLSITYYVGPWYASKSMTNVADWMDFVGEWNWMVLATGVIMSGLFWIENYYYRRPCAPWQNGVR